MCQSPLFDLIMHLKRVQSDLIPIQKLLANPDIPPQVKYVLTRAIFPTMEDDNAVLALGGFERAIQKLSAESLIAAFGGNDDEFCSGARRVLDQVMGIPDILRFKKLFNNFKKYFFYQN